MTAKTRSAAVYYEIDPERSACSIRGGAAVLSRPGDLPWVTGALILDLDNALESRVRIVAGNRRNGTEIRFVSRKAGQRAYWVPGALSIDNLTAVGPLRICGPTAEARDARGDVRADAIAIINVGASRLGTALEQWPQPLPEAPLMVEFRMHLVRRSIGQGGTIAA